MALRRARRAADLGPLQIDEALPPPLVMNCWKHHAPSAVARALAAAACGEAEVQALPGRLLPIGSALMDLYLGSLPLATLAAEVLDQLRVQRALEAAAFGGWVAAGGGHRTLELSDGSRWVARISPLPGRHVHLHPARHSPHSVRTTANRLRSALLALACARLRGGDPSDLALYNESRRLLALPPVRSLDAASGVGGLLRRLAALGDAAAGARGTRR
jgi:hypothetical protein